MNILNPLPDLLSYAYLAPFLLRIVIGTHFLNQIITILGVKLQNKKTLKIKNALKYLIGIETFSAIALIIGFYTQIAVLILIITTIINLILEQKSGGLKKTKLQLYIFILAILSSLLVTGAGFFSIDLPL
jgi:uncharacterized membrane protein YphA (DoxX/SURF4 family)